MENLIEALTSKNREYIHAVTKQLILIGKTDEEVKTILNEILPQIIEGQKSNLTARKLLGTPTEFVEQYQTKKPATKAETDKNENPFLMWMDSSLLFFGFMAVLSGVTSVFSKTAPVYGLVTLIASGIFAGLAMYLMYRFFYRPRAEGERVKWNWKSLGIVLLAFFFWAGATFLTAMLPTSINLQMAPVVVLLVGVVVLVIRWVIKRQFNIQSALTAQPKAK
jgi:uncharacterized membrane-anchored protein